MLGQRKRQSWQVLHQSVHSAGLEAQAALELEAEQELELAEQAV